MSVPSNINDFIKTLINYHKENVSIGSVTKVANEIKVQRNYLKGFYDGLYITNFAEKVISEKQYNSYKINLEKIEKLLNDKKL